MRARNQPRAEAREQALSYVRQRAGYGRAEIQVLDESGNVAERISNEEARAARSNARHNS
jgi:hypothetical protein